MNEQIIFGTAFIMSILISIAISLSVALVIFTLGKLALRHEIEPTKEMLTTKEEYYMIVFGVLLMLEGGYMISEFVPPESIFDWGMFTAGSLFVIIGTLLQILMHEQTKKVMKNIELRIKAIEDNCQIKKFLKDEL